MKASTLFAIAAAVLLGLAVVAAARYQGLFDAAPAADAPPPAPRPSVLVAARNLFDGVILQTTDVRVRELRADEMDDYLENRDQYLPAVANAAAMRVLIRPIEADRPILRKDLESLTLPEGPGGELPKGLQAVNVGIPKERAVGGLIRKGDRVDVLLTTRVSAGPDEPGITLTAPIARNLKVLFKRDMLWTALLPVPEDRPINFTLAANPYRAALITFAQKKGDLSLVPSSSKGEPDDIERQIDRRAEEEDLERSRMLRRGELVVGDRDLEIIFKLGPIPAPPERKPVAIHLMSGIMDKGYAVFDPYGRPAPPPTRFPHRLIQAPGNSDALIKVDSPEGTKDQIVIGENKTPATPWNHPAMGYVFGPPSPEEKRARSDSRRR